MRMKEIMSIIRMNKVNETKRALLDIGIFGMTAIKVMGRGKMTMDLGKLVDSGEELRGLIEDTLSTGGRLIPKRLFSIIVPDEQLKEVIDVIIRVNQQGSRGDGKIFILPIQDVVRLRTGERGEQAI